MDEGEKSVCFRNSARPWFLAHSERTLARNIVCVSVLSKQMQCDAKHYIFIGSKAAEARNSDNALNTTHFQGIFSHIETLTNDAFQ